MIGLWVEIGSATYQKYSWPSLFNLHDLSPDPVVRKHLGMLLDVALVEEAQVSIRGRRGGGRSRAAGVGSGFDSYKNLLYAPPDGKAGCSHSKVIEACKYQAPAAAIMLRKMAFPAEEPFLIVNRVPGELRPFGKEEWPNSYVADSALVNYVCRTPYYMLGCTWKRAAGSSRATEKRSLLSNCSMAATPGTKRRNW